MIGLQVRQIIVPERRAVIVRGDHCLERKPWIGC